MSRHTTQATYEQLVVEVKRLQSGGVLPIRPTQEQRASWAYGQTKLKNSDVTPEDAVQAVAARTPTLP